MLGIAIHCIQHSQAMLERGVCELAHSFFHFTFTQGWIVLSLVESDSGEDDEHVKSLRKRQRQGQQRRRRRTTDTF